LANNQETLSPKGAQQPNKKPLVTPVKPQGGEENNNEAS
jgi:hypothetical protein